MEHHVTWFTVLLNKLFGNSVLAVLDALGIHIHDRVTPIPEYFSMSLVVVLMGIVGTLWLKRRLSVDCPGAVQQMAELLLTNPYGAGIRDVLDMNVHHNGRQYLVMVGTVSIFVLISNLISVVPAFSAPTAVPAVPLACALITFAYFNWRGIRQHGLLQYLKHFAGPVWWMGWLIFPVEIVSTSARVLSLTVRLWANMFSSELIYLTILNLLLRPTVSLLDSNPIGGVLLGVFTATLPVAFVGLHIFVALVQTLVFTILPAVYIGLAVAKEH